MKYKSVCVILFFSKMKKTYQADRKHWIFNQSLPYTGRSGKCNIIYFHSTLWFESTKPEV
jgi:hypothetical protein